MAGTEQSDGALRAPTVGVLGAGAIGTFLGWALVKAADAEGFISVFQVPIGSLAVVLLVVSFVVILSIGVVRRLATRHEAAQER